MTVPILSSNAYQGYVDNVDDGVDAAQSYATTFPRGLLSAIGKDW